MKTLVIIPAYNEEANIVRVVEELTSYGYDYVVINDGSTDNTAAICKENGYHLIDMPVNVGLAGVVQTGMKYAYQKGYDCAVQLDGDGQHDPSYLEEMIRYMQKHNCDIVIGSRFVQEKKPATLRMLGSDLIQFAIRITTRQHISDPTSGLRLYRRTMLKIFANDINLTPEPDSVSYLIRCGAKVSEVQVKMRERIAGESYLNFSRSMQYMLRMVVSILLIQWFRVKKKLEDEVMV